MPGTWGIMELPFAVGYNFRERVSLWKVYGKRTWEEIFMSIEDLKELMADIKSKSEERPEMCTEEAMNMINKKLLSKFNQTDN